MGAFRRGAPIWRARGRIFHWVWAAAFWLEARRHGLSGERDSARRLCADGGAGPQRDRFGGAKTHRRSRRADEQEALATRADLPGGTRGQPHFSCSPAERLLCVEGRPLSEVHG